MRAVLYTGGKPSWAEVLGERPWALLPIAGRPLLSYWLELCIDLGIHEVQVILGQDAEYIEMFCGNGEKWGLNISYSFIRSEDCPQTYLSRDPERWSEGLFYIGMPLFPRREHAFTKETGQILREGCCVRHDGFPAFFINRDARIISDFISQGICTKGDTCSQRCESNGRDCRIPAAAGIDLTFIQDVGHYYRLNMEVVRGEMDRYLSGGYATHDGAAIGYNVITPPSVTFTPPLAIGNDCRIGALSSIGPGAVISDHVLIDRQCELSDCIILSDTYIGRNLEIKEKIVSGNRIIDPADGTHLDIEDPWLVAQTRSRNVMRDFLRASLGWEIALLMALVQFIPFIILYSLIQLLGRGRFARTHCLGIGGKKTTVFSFNPDKNAPSILLMVFCGFSLDRFPQLLNVLRGRLWLCGQVPKPAMSELKETRRYFPAVFSYSDAFAEIDKQMDALYYAHTRSAAADLRILRHALFARLVEMEIVSGATPAPAV